MKTLTISPCSGVSRGERALKSGWHVLLMIAALAEFKMASTRFRRNTAMACAGWHLAAAIDDWSDE